MTTMMNLRQSSLLVALVATVGMSNVQLAFADGPTYVRIEEDWELVLNTPDLSFPAPQIVIAMKPSVHSTKTAMFLVNHHDSPQFQAGGGQIQIWDDDVLRSYKSFAGPTLIREGERVTWTQYMTRANGRFHFGLKAVEGEAWGTNTADTLGGPISFSDWRHVFDDYSSDNSVEAATITFADERVNSLRLVRVRKYKSGDTDQTCDVEEGRTVFPQP